MQFRVCLIQIACKEGEREVNFERARFLVQDLDPFDGPQIIALPELFAIGFNPEDYRNEGPGVPGPTMEFLQSFAREKESYVVSTGIESVGTKYYNTLMLVNPDGLVLGTYRKIHPFQAEKEIFEGGDSMLLFELEDIKVGVQICYDLRFPEITRRLAIEGAEIVITPAAWPDPRSPHWNALLRARAVENQIYMAAVNRVRLSFDEKTYFGHSQLIDPYGACLTRINSEERIVVEEGNTDVLEIVRGQITCWADRVPSAYDKVRIVRE